MGTTLVTSSAQVIHLAEMLLLLLLWYGDSKPNMVAEPDVGWIASPAKLAVATLCFMAGCCAFCFVFLVPSCFLLLYLVPVVVFLVIRFLISFQHCRGRGIFLLQILWCAGVYRFLFPRVIAVHCMAESSCCVRVCNAYPCLVVCGHITRLSRKHPHGHRLFRM